MTSWPAWDQLIGPCTGTAAVVELRVGVGAGLVAGGPLAVPERWDELITIAVSRPATANTRIRTTIRTIRLGRRVCCRAGSSRGRLLVGPTAGGTGMTAGVGGRTGTVRCSGSMLSGCVSR